jgi:hypothetical protein
LSWCLSRYRDAVAVTKIDHGVTMRVRANEGLRFLDCLRVAEVVQLNRVKLWIKVFDRVSTD